MAFAPPFEPIEVISDIRCDETEAYILRSYRANDGIKFAVTIDESASATLMATSWLHGVSALRIPNELFLIRVL
jgi:hypothetical protein